MLQFKKLLIVLFCYNARQVIKLNHSKSAFFDKISLPIPKFLES